MKKTIICLLLSILFTNAYSQDSTKTVNTSLTSEEVKPEEAVFADSAYSSEELKRATKNKSAEPLFCMKGKRNKPLNKAEREWNRCLSKIRCRVEHVFGDIKSFGMNRIRSIGIERARLQIFLGNMTYNMRRTVYLKGAYHA